MPIDSASSSPVSRRTIIVRLAHGQPRATTSRYRPASAGSEPSRPSAVIRPSGPHSAMRLKGITAPARA